MHRFLSCCSVFVTKFQLEIPSWAKRLYVDRTRNNSVPESMFTRLEKWGVGGGWRTWEWILPLVLKQFLLRWRG